MISSNNALTSVALLGLFVFFVPARGDLVINGRFKLGDFAAWSTLSAPLDSNYGVQPNTSHSGTFAALFGGLSEGNYDEISQTLATIPNSPYTLSFWLKNPDGGIADFQALVGGKSIDVSGVPFDFGITSGIW